MSIDLETAAKVAKLARIKVEEDALPALASEFNTILGFIEQLNEVDVAGVEPMTSVTPQRLKRREDVVTDGNMQDRILSNAPDAREELQNHDGAGHWATALGHSDPRGAALGGGPPQTPHPEPRSLRTPDILPLWLERPAPLGVVRAAAVVLAAAHLLEPPLPRHAARATPASTGTPEANDQ